MNIVFEFENSQAEIVPLLHQGGLRSWAIEGLQFDVIVNVSAHDIRPGFSFRGLYVEWPIFDSADIPSRVLLHSLAGFVANCVRNGKKVLVHCQAGLNRSGIVTALAMVELGYSPDEAISILRSKRSEYALCNPDFEQYIRTRS